MSLVWRNDEKIRRNGEEDGRKVHEHGEETADMEGKLDAVSNDVRGFIQTTLVNAFNEMKDVLVKMDKKIEENTRKVRCKPSDDKENIIVVGGFGTDSVEMFNWHQRIWLPLKSIPNKGWGATSFVYNNHLTIAGGYLFDNMIRMNIDPTPNLSTNWSDFPVERSSSLTLHTSVLYEDHLIVTGGVDLHGSLVDFIREVQLVHPYNVKILSRMKEPRKNHCTELFDDSLLIVGGKTTLNDSLSSVVLYDIKKNEFKQLSPLPYEVSDMATVAWGDNIVVIGGYDKHGRTLDTVVIYNVKTEQSHMLPPMKFKRSYCTAVVIENNIVVLGGCGKGGALTSVETFDFERYSWDELPGMSQERFCHTAIVV